MVIIRLWGGLGNQMFQYAMGYALAKRNGDFLMLDTHFFTDEYLKENPRFSRQKLNIINFPLEYKKTIDATQSIKGMKCLQGKTMNRIIRVPSSFSCIVGDGFRYVKETRLQFSKKIATLKSAKIYLDGYWQSEMYFEDIKQDIFRQFSLFEEETKNEACKLHIEGMNSVSIHLRMGDYSKKKKAFSNLQILAPSYYRSAIETVKSEVDDPIFYIFTNDFAKARQILCDVKSCVFVNEDRKLSDQQEMALMSMCKHQIIANSTFSWWAAWLNRNEQKRVYAPDVMFGNRDIIPDAWIKINEFEK